MNNIKTLIGSPIKVPSGCILNDNFEIIKEKFKKGLFIKYSKSGKYFTFLHLPSCKILKRPVNKMRVWLNEKEYIKLVTKHYHQIKSKLNI